MVFKPTLLFEAVLAAPLPTSLSPQLWGQGLSKPNTLEVRENPEFPDTSIQATYASCHGDVLSTTLQHGASQPEASVNLIFINF